jgi:signal recognition particle subunit SEC65
MKEAKIREIIGERVKELKKELGYKYFTREVKGYGGCFWEENFLENIEINSLKERFNALLKHLGLEYFKQEIKETNGKEKTTIKEGFRKIKVGVK